MAATKTTKSNFAISIGPNQTYDLTGSDDSVTLSSDDILGLYGSNNYVLATGAGDSVWLGTNGQLSAPDEIVFQQAGYLYEMGSSNVNMAGSHVNVTMNDWDTLSAFGSAIHISASGPGEILFMGGDGVYASDADEDTATFATGGTLNLFANARADIEGSHVTAILAGQDTLGLYGSGDTITSTGALANSYVWVGQNGKNASAANVDLVTLTTAARSSSWPTPTSASSDRTLR